MIIKRERKTLKLRQRMKDSEINGKKRLKDPV